MKLTELQWNALQTARHFLVESKFKTNGETITGIDELLKGGVQEPTQKTDFVIKIDGAKVVKIIEEEFLNLQKRAIIISDFEKQALQCALDIVQERNDGGSVEVARHLNNIIVRTNK